VEKEGGKGGETEGGKGGGKTTCREFLYAMGAMGKRRVPCKSFLPELSFFPGGFLATSILEEILGGGCGGGGGCWVGVKNILRAAFEFLRRIQL